MTISNASTSLSAAAAALASGETTATALVDSCLERIDAHNQALGAFLLVDKEGAQKKAAEADARRKRGEAKSPLDGIPIGLKDNIVTKGLTTTAASKILEGWTPPYTGTCAQKLEDAGAILLGKLNLDEFAMGSSNENSAYGVVKNPWDQERIPGGSSGGAASAVAANLCLGALGTDTGGSIRQPAGLCGVVGIKPTYGRVSRFGVVAFASSLDQVGPFARDCEGAAHMLGAIAGYDERDATSIDRPVDDYAAAVREKKTVRVGVPKEARGTDGIDAEIAAALEKTCDALGGRDCEVVDIELPLMRYAIATYYVIATAEASSNLARYDGIRFGPREDDGEGLNPLYENTRGRRFGDEVKRRIMLGTHVLSSGYYDAYYGRAQRVRRKIFEDYARALENVDVILTPTSPTPAFKLGERTDAPLAMYKSDLFTIGANLAGLPGVSVNAAMTSGDKPLPIGMQFIGRPFEEATVLSAAAHVEDAFGLKDIQPPL